MGWLKKGIGWVWSHLGTITLVAGWVMSVTIPPWILSLSEWANTNPILYVVAAVSGALAFLAGRALWWKGRELRYSAKFKERLTSSSSAFDPMAKSYQDKQLFLRDFVPPGRRLVQNIKFTNCEIIGPGNIVVALDSEQGRSPLFRGNTYYDVDCIQIQRGVLSNNAIYFPGCDFDGCDFHNINLLFFERVAPDWHWITPLADQQVLIEPSNPEDTKHDE